MTKPNQNPDLEGELNKLFEYGAEIHLIQKDSHDSFCETCQEPARGACFRANWHIRTLKGKLLALFTRHLAVAVKEARRAERKSILDSFSGFYKPFRNRKTMRTEALKLFIYSFDNIMPEDRLAELNQGKDSNV